MPKLLSSASMRKRSSTGRVKSWGDIEQDEYSLSTQTSKLLMDDGMERPTYGSDNPQLNAETRQRLRNELFSSRHYSQKRPNLPNLALSTSGNSENSTLQRHVASPAVDIQTAIVILNELKKTATIDDLVALHRALLPDLLSPQSPPNNTSPAAPAISARYAEMRRRRSLYKPGEATRTQDTSELVQAKSKSSQAEQIKAPVPAATTGIPLLGLPHPDVARTATPSDFDRAYLGTYKIGSLRITNGAASPMPSIIDGRTRNASASSGGKEEDYFTASECSERHSPEKLGAPNHDDMNDGETTPRLALITATDCDAPSVLQTEIDTVISPIRFQLKEVRGMPMLDRRDTRDTVTSQYSWSSAASPDTARSDQIGNALDTTRISSRLDIMSSRGSVRISDYQNSPYDQPNHNHEDTFSPEAVAVAEDRLENFVPEFHGTSSTRAAVKPAIFVDTNQDGFRDSGYGSVSYTNQYRPQSQQHSSDRSSNLSQQVIVQGDVEVQPGSAVGSTTDVLTQENQPDKTGKETDVVGGSPSGKQHVQLLSRPELTSTISAHRQTYRQSLSPNFRAKAIPEAVPGTPKRLQKKRPQSERTQTAPLIVQRVRTVNGCPEPSDSVLVAYARRMNQNPGMDSLLRTYKSVADSGSRESLCSVSTMPLVEYKFPSPPPSPTEEARGRKFFGFGRSRGMSATASRSLNRQHSEDLSQSRERLISGDFEAVAADLPTLDNTAIFGGRSPYDSARSFSATMKTSVRPRTFTSKPQVSIEHTPPQPTTRIRGMSSAAAAALALARSRDKLLDAEQDPLVLPAVDAERDADAGQGSWPDADTPPVPPVPLIRRKSRPRSVEMQAELQSDVKEVSMPQENITRMVEVPEPTNTESTVAQTSPVRAARPKSQRILSQQCDGSIINRPRPKARRSTTVGSIVTENGEATEYSASRGATPLTSPSREAQSTNKVQSASPLVPQRESSGHDSIQHALASSTSGSIQHPAQSPLTLSSPPAQPPSHHQTPRPHPSRLPPLSPPLRVLSPSPPPRSPLRISPSRPPPPPPPPLHRDQKPTTIPHLQIADHHDPAAPVSARRSCSPGFTAFIEPLLDIDTAMQEKYVRNEFSAQSDWCSSQSQDVYGREDGCNYDDYFYEYDDYNHDYNYEYPAKADDHYPSYAYDHSQTQQTQQTQSRRSGWRDYS